MDKIIKTVQELNSTLKNLEKQLKEYEKDRIIKKYFGSNNDFTAKMFLENISNFEWDNIKGDFDGQYGNFFIYAIFKNSEEEKVNVIVNFRSYISDDDYWDTENECEKELIDDKLWNPVIIFKNKLDKLKESPDKIIKYSIDDYNDIEFIV